MAESLLSTFSGACFLLICVIFCLPTLGDCEYEETCSSQPALTMSLLRAGGLSRALCRSWLPEQSEAGAVPPSGL